MGPSVKVAYKDGVPTAAAEAFAKKAGVAVDSLKTVTTSKGEYLAATSTKQGRDAAEVIAAELPKELAGIYWAKNMYWRAGRPERFVRPVRWMVALLGEKTGASEFWWLRGWRGDLWARVLFGDEANYAEVARQSMNTRSKRALSLPMSRCDGRGFARHWTL